MLCAAGVVGGAGEARPGGVTRHVCVDRLLACRYPVLPRILANPRNEMPRKAKPMQGKRLYMVAEDGIEPPTRGFSIPCSTN